MIKLSLLGFIAIIFCASQSFGQARNAGEAVVPVGNEHDSLARVGIFSIKDEVIDGWHNMDSMLDDIHCSFDEEFGDIGRNNLHLGGLREGAAAPGLAIDPKPNISDFVFNIKQRTFFALPFRLSSFTTSGFLWKYNDLNINGSGAAYYNNTYDANDISPYVEYPQKDSIVKATFQTSRYGATQSVYYGNEGRVILGRSDDEDATALLLGTWNKMFPGIRDIHGNLTIPDTAKLFSATLEFNLDDANIDTAFASGRSTDALPLLRLQILYKGGKNTTDSIGRSVNPVVPFQTAANPSNSGWLALVDTIITKKIYDSLKYSWRAPDALANGSPSHSWKFRQLHVQLKGGSAGMDSLIRPIPGNWLSLGQGYGSSITTFLHPDSSGFDDNSGTFKENIIEMRVLSTYRTTARVRSLTFGDTTSDKFLYRVPSGDSSWSCNPDGSSPGGYDSAVSAVMKAGSDSINNKPFEFILLDYGAAVFEYTHSMLGYLEYIGYRYGIHMHIHQQDWGNESATFRREAISYSGRPPSLFENERQQGAFPSTPILPLDYVFYGHPYNSSLPWPTDSTDKRMGLYITRPLNSDSLAAYRAYSNMYDGNSLSFYSYRSSALVALQHPNNKKLALEMNIPAWGSLNTGTVWQDTAYTTHYNTITHQTDTTWFGHFVYDQTKASYTYNQRMPTPEEIICGTFQGFANGFTSFNNAQAFDPASPYGSLTGIWNVSVIPGGVGSAHWVHNLNFGHRYSQWSQWGTPHGQVYALTNGSNDIDGSLPNYYVGFSNSFRAMKRVIDRINQIFDSSATNLYPVRSMQWIDAFQAQGAHQPGTSDSISNAASFIKIVKTIPVQRWARAHDSTYIDQAIADSTQNTFVSVGLFKRTNLTTPAYGAMVINTRLYPSLRDTADLNYYNAGMDSLSRCRSTLGDIDVRKVVMRIDTSQFDSTFRSFYYVVRDLWHPDTTWLVHRDSTFAIYLKPGDAKFLYIEKGVSIKAAPTSATDLTEFAFNNGRRVAERWKATKDVICYTKNHLLCVSYPAKGQTFGGYNEHSQFDNIATGNEITTIDPTHFVARPSISVAQNDTGVAMVYWMKDAVGLGRIRVAYQPHPDSAWKLTDSLNAVFPDTTYDHSWVTPVIAPYDDTTWVVAAGNHTGGVGSGILGIRVFTPKGKKPRFDTVSDLALLVTDLPAWRWGPSLALFPTEGTRPMADASYPWHFAFQLGDSLATNIFFERFKFGGTNHPIADGPYYICVSGDLPNCFNFHPSLSISGYEEDAIWQSSDTNYTILTPQYLTTEITFENSSNLSGPYTPVVKNRIQQIGTTAISWSNFVLFPPQPQDNFFHYPVISAEPHYITIFTPFPHGVYIGGTPWPPKNKGKIIKTYPIYDPTRLAWQDQGSLNIEFAHDITGSVWSRTKFLEGGAYPSQAQSADSAFRIAPHRPTAPRSIAFRGPLQQLNNLYDVRVTNGWMPFVAPFEVKPEVDIVDSNGNNCDDRYIIIIPGHVQLGVTVGPPSDRGWAPVNHNLPTDAGNIWPTIPGIANSIHTDSLTVHSGDTIRLQRTMSLLDSVRLRSHLSTTDYIKFIFKLKRLADSSTIGTIDSLIFTKTGIRAPGYGSDPTYAYFVIPPGRLIDTAFVTLDVLRGTMTDSLKKIYIESIIADSANYAVSRKKSTGRVPLPPADFSLLVFPNPFNPTTTIAFTAVKGVESTVDVYDVMGRLVTTLFKGKATGSEQRFTFEGSNLSSGTYMIRAVSGNKIVTRRVQMVK